MGRLRRAVGPERVCALLARVGGAIIHASLAAGEAVPVIGGAVETAPVRLLSGDDYAPEVIRRINGARESIRLAMYAISAAWPARGSREHDVFAVLAATPARGIRCSAVLASHPRGSKTARYNLSAAVKLVEAGWTIRWATQARLLHAKFIQFDSGAAIIGSHNISHSAIVSNVDLSVVVDFSAAGNPASQWWESVLRSSQKAGPSPWQS